MLSISEIETKAKIDNLKQRLEYLNRDYLFKIINEETYNKEKALISQELYDIEHKHDINSLNDMFDNPMQQIDKLIEEGRKLFR